MRNGWHIVVALAMLLGAGLLQGEGATDQSWGHSSAMTLDCRDDAGSRLVRGGVRVSPVAEAADSAATLGVAGKAAAGWSVDNPVWDSTGTPDGSVTAVLTEGGRSFYTELLALNDGDVSFHGGVLSVDEGWTADKVHVIQYSLRVPEAVTLTIASGTVVKVCPGAKILVEGTLLADGATVTSLHDDSVGGDTDRDGGEHAPTDGDVELVGSGKLSLDGGALRYGGNVTGWTLKGIALSGAGSIAYGGTERYVCLADYGTDGSVAVTPHWSITQDTLADVSADGAVTSRNTAFTDQTVTLNATYSGKTASKTVTLARRANAVETLSISGPDAIELNGKAAYVCTATRTDGTVAQVQPAWTLSGTDAAWLADGTVTNVTRRYGDTTTTLTAVHEGKTSAKAIRLAGRETPTIEVEYGDGTSSAYEPGRVVHVHVRLLYNGEHEPAWSMSLPEGWTQCGHVVAVPPCADVSTDGASEAVTAVYKQTASDGCEIEFDVLAPTTASGSVTLAGKASIGGKTVSKVLSLERKASAVSVSLQSGWNLLGVTQKLDDSSRKALAALSPMAFDAADAVYKEASSMEPGDCLWVHCDVPRTLVLEGTTATSWGALSLAAGGWRLVCPATDVSMLSGIVAREWDGGSFHLVLDGRLRGGHSYWLRSQDDSALCALTYTLFPTGGGWSIDGRTFASGESVLASAGAHEVAFVGTDGYSTPDARTVTLEEGTVVALNQTYVEPREYVVIDLSPGAGASFYPWRYSATGPDVSQEACRTTELWLRRIPAGAFTMGSPVGELGRQTDETCHQVTLTEEFYMAVFECTQRQWELVMGTRPAYFANATHYAGRPVEQVSYDDIRGGSSWPGQAHAAEGNSFLGRLQTRTGIVLDLPTEAQWEYACRLKADGGCWDAALNSGKALTATGKCPNMAAVGRYSYNNGGSSSTGGTSQGTAKAGSYQPSELGLYDLHGNVAEWCLDWYGAYDDTVENPAGASSGTMRVVRGGSWYDDAQQCRAASRVSCPSDTRGSATGFRPVALPARGMHTLTCNLTPDSATWSVNGKTYASGAVATLPTGTYKVAFGEVPGYTAPDDRTVELNVNMALNRTYDSKMFTLTYTLEPSTARWTVNGKTYASNGSASLPMGTYRVTFSTVQAYATPEAETVELLGDTAKTVSYVRTYPLTYTLTPSSAKWTVDGRTYASGAKATLPQGDYSVTFTDVSGYATPREETVVLAEAVSLSKSYGKLYTLSYTLTPATARWMVDGKTYASGEKASLPAAVYRVEFQQLDGYETPSAESVKLTANTTKRASYSQLFALSYALTPNYAKWKVNGKVYGSGQTAMLPPGSYKVTFTDADGYKTPSAETVTLSSDATKSVSYAELFFLSYTLTPSNAKWKVNGKTFASGQVAMLPAGTYQITFADADGYRTPSAETVTLSSDAMKSVSYVRLYSLSYTLTPDTATWTLNGNAYASGAAATLPAGTYRVTFSDADGYKTPSAETVTLSSDATKNVSYLRLYSLSYTLTPSNAKWTVNGNSYASGATATLPEGTYQVTFSYADGYKTPSAETVTLSSDTTKSVSYLRLYSLSYTLTPDSATWTVNGKVYTSGTTTTLPEGTYLVTFSEIEGYQTPYAQKIVLSGNTTKSVAYKTASGTGKTYLVIDLSGGASATSYSYRYSANGPDVSQDACCTTELWLRQIPAGTFTMGSPEDELGRNSDESQHQVTLTEDYYIGVFECTQKQWELVMGMNPSCFTGDCRPVEKVSYNTIRGSDGTSGVGWPEYGHAVDADSFMGRLQARTGLVLDLPSEAQWEYACRKRDDGSCWTKALNSGKNLTDECECSNVAEVGRYGYNESDGSGGYGEHTKVGSYQPSELGLYDMHGNVWEWCLDWYDSYSGTAKDPKGVATGTRKVIRGGGWGINARDCRAASRLSYYPSRNNYSYGFRVACFTIDDTCTLTYTLTPSNAKWTVDGRTYASGAAATLPAGTYRVTFSEIEGYQTPDAQDVVLSKNTTKTIAYETASGTDKAYLVIDLSGGASATSYSYRYSATAPDVSQDTCRTTELWLRRIPAGSALLGAPDDEVGQQTSLYWNAGFPEYTFAQHTVTFTQDFYAGIFEVTQRQWELVMGSRPSKLNNSQYYATRPVDSISYDMIRGTSATGGTGWPSYGHAVDASSFMGVIRAKTGLLLDLPTDAQWEYACRAGTTTALNTGRNLTDAYSCASMDEAGRYRNNNGDGGSESSASVNLSKGSNKVGSYLPNAWGLYDMHGNLWEWCLDWKAINKSTENVVDPVGPESGGPDRIRRGGSYIDPASVCRSAIRDKTTTSSSHNHARYGFRLVYLPCETTPKYLVVDLSEGANAASYPVRYSDSGPDVSQDACRTTELWLRQIPAGTFTMGSPSNEVGRYSSDMAQHQVTISQMFYIGVFECTQRQWELVMGTKLSYFSNATYYATRPVEQVSYNMIRGTGTQAGAGWPTYGHTVDASSFMGRIQERTGLVFDLPTEAQWEYACRLKSDGSSWITALNSGKNLTDEYECSNMAEVGRYWYNGGSGYSQSCSTENGTAKVGSYQLSGLGLYDMHGNVWEWCLDWWGGSTTGTNAETDPEGPSGGSSRVLRGGGWRSNASNCRAASRSSSDPSHYWYGDGFRVACWPLVPCNIEYFA